MNVWLSIRNLLHWLTAVLLAVSLGSAWVLWNVADADEWPWVKQLHVQVGMFLFVLVMLRLIVKARVIEQPDFGTGRFIRWIANWAHRALYALLLTMTVSGLAMTAASGKKLFLHKILGLHLLIRPDPDLADNLYDLHTAVSWMLVGLVCAHVFAALYHSLILKDGVMASMLIFRRRTHHNSNMTEHT